MALHKLKFRLRKNSPKSLLNFCAISLIVLNVVFDHLRQERALRSENVAAIKLG